MVTKIRKIETFDRKKLSNYILNLSADDIKRVLSQVKPMPKSDFAFGTRMPLRYEICNIKRYHKFGPCFWKKVFKTTDFIELMHCALTAKAGEFKTGTYTLVPIYTPNTRIYVAELEIKNNLDTIDVILFKRVGAEGREEVFRHQMIHRRD